MTIFFHPKILLLGIVLSILGQALLLWLSVRKMLNPYQQPQRESKKALLYGLVTTLLSVIITSCQLYFINCTVYVFSLFSWVGLLAFLGLGLSFMTLSSCLSVIKQR